MTVEARGRNEDGSRQTTLRQLIQSDCYCPAIGVVESYRGSRTPVSFLVDLIKGRYIDELDQRVQLRREIVRGNEECSFTDWRGTVRYDSVVGENEAFPPNSMAHCPASARRRERALRSLLEEVTEPRILCVQTAAIG
jgi:hypothetical protein